MRDIDAVAAAVGFRSVRAGRRIWSVPVAIAYAAKHPERVSHLVLFGAWARGDDLWEIPVSSRSSPCSIRAIGSCRGYGWTQRCRLAAPGVARLLASVERSSRTLEHAQRFYAAVRQSRLAAMLPTVSVPTVVHPHARCHVPDRRSSARKVAAAIPGARFKILESETAWSDAMEPFLLDALDEFIGDGERDGRTSRSPKRER